MHLFLNWVFDFFFDEVLFLYNEKKKVFRSRKKGTTMYDDNDRSEINAYFYAY